MEMQNAVVANYIQRRNAFTALVLADDDTEEEKLADAIFADYINEHNQIIAPGKGAIILEHVDLYCELAEYLKANKMNWRGQFHRSNTACIFLEVEGGSVDRATKTINKNCYINLMTVDGRKGAFYGRGLAGAGVTPPPPL